MTSSETDVLSESRFVFLSKLSPYFMGTQIYKIASSQLWKQYVCVYIL